MDALSQPAGLIPDHILAAPRREDAQAWLIDCFGAAHPIPTGTILVGRKPPAGIQLLNASVSREHAELRKNEVWQLRDLGSRNGTFVDGSRVTGRVDISERCMVRFGDISLWFIPGPRTMPTSDPPSIATGHAADSGAFRVILAGPAIELCLVGSNQADEEIGGALLHRPIGGDDWAELSLPTLEYRLLRVLCDNALAEAGSPSRSRGCVATKQLARTLPFKSRYANEENVRQLVRRFRATLVAVGVEDLVMAAPGRGYYLAWPVKSS